MTFTTKRPGACKFQLVLPSLMPTVAWAGKTSVIIAWKGVTG